MKQFTILTLVDVTETGQYRYDPARAMEQLQQQNFMVMLQTIGMRANPVYDQSPTRTIVNLKDYSFGTAYTGLHRVWKFTFGIEYQEAFYDETGNETGLLIQDFYLIPIIGNLQETANIQLPVFDSKSNDARNILIFSDPINN